MRKLFLAGIFTITTSFLIAAPVQADPCYIRSDDYETNVERCTALAEQGDAESQYYLGYFYYKGKLLGKDREEAAKWFLKSAKQGNLSSQLYLGKMYLRGRGVPQSNADSLKWYRAAAEQGHEHAQFQVGNMYANGTGTARDYNEAARWYDLAAKQGNGKAAQKLAALQRESKVSPPASAAPAPAPAPAPTITQTAPAVSKPAPAPTRQAPSRTSSAGQQARLAEQRRLAQEAEQERLAQAAELKRLEEEAARKRAELAELKRQEQEAERRQQARLEQQQREAAAAAEKQRAAELARQKADTAVDTETDFEQELGSDPTMLYILIGAGLLLVTIIIVVKKKKADPRDAGMASVAPSPAAKPSAAEGRQSALATPADEKPVVKEGRKSVLDTPANKPGKTEKKENKGKIGAKHIGVIILTSCIFGAMGGGIAMLVWEFEFAPAAIVATIGMAPIMYLLYSWYYRCKKCGTKWAREAAHEEDISTYIIKKKEDVHENGIKFKRDVEYRVREYWQYFICKECGDVTRERKKEESRVW